jgi:hypothetical protein
MPPAPDLTLLHAGGAGYNPALNLCGRGRIAVARGCMAESEQKSSPLESAELVVSAERHEQLQDIVAYVKGLHHFIDPDMYDIPLKQLEQLEWCVEGVEFESEGYKEYYGFRMPVSWEDLRFIETVVMAADTYSHRKTTGYRVDNLTDQGFDDLLKWLAKAEDDLFRSKLKKS